MRRIEKPKRPLALATACVGALALAACTGGGSGDLDRDREAPRLQGALTSFDSCDEALKELKASAKQNSDGFGASGEEDMSAQGEAGSAKSPESESGTDHSGTNVQEKGVDEPDVVKTDGERIVSIDEGRLYVVDADSEQITGSVEFGDSSSRSSGSQMLLRGDRVLVITPNDRTRAPEAWDKDSLTRQPTTGLTLVSLAEDEPEVVNDYVVEGSYLDARSVEDMSRIVITSSPRLQYDDPGFGSDEPDVEAAIENSKIDDWLPRYYVNGEQGQVPCQSVARPSDYSGKSMLTILSFDLTEKLDDGSPVSIEADGNTVYGTGEALYVANDRQQFAAQTNDAADARTELFRFELGGGGAPKFESSEKVPGYLLNQYSMSEWDGYLRVATTKQAQWNNGKEAEESSSTVHTLKVGKKSLTKAGHIGGLGKGERIKAVRFVAGTGYVVTFKQTDPLYTIDLSKPEKPRTTGELKIPGYSAYLHPVSDDRLIGVGKDGDQNGNLTGAQVGLYDVSDPQKPAETDRFAIDGASTEVEHDPHAFLYWPDREYVIVPVSSDTGTRMLVLKIGTNGLSKVGTVKHENSDDSGSDARSIVIGTALWTISPSGMMASDIDSLEEREWLSYGLVGENAAIHCCED